jgi:uncharacterized protein
MSRANVEAAKLIYEHLNQGDIAAVLAVLDPNVEWWTRADNPDTAVVKGREGVSALWAEITGVLEELHMEPTEIIDAGEYVVTAIHQVARTRGASIEQYEVHVGRFRNGKVTEMREFHDMDEALRAVGFAE